MKKWKMRNLMYLKDGDDGGGGGGGTPDWKETLPEPIRDWDEVKQSETPDAFWDQVTNMRSHLGQSVRIPSKEASSEDWNAFNKKLKDAVPTLVNKPNLDDDEAMADFYGTLGRPATHEDYKVPEVEGVDVSLLKNAREVAHKAGLTGKQFDKMSEFFVGNGKAQAEAMQAQQKKEYEALNNDWGLAFDTNTKIVENFLTKMEAPEDLTVAFKRQGLNAESQKWLLKMAKSMGGEFANIANDKNSKEPVMTPAEAALQISDIMRNRQHPFWNPTDPAHKAAKEKMRQLYIYKNGSNSGKPAPASTF